MKKNIRQAKKLTVAYLRVSSEEQRERHTIETQRAEMTRYAALRGIKIDRFYEDDGVSGTVAFGERPRGGALWEDIVAGKIASVLIYGIDRIARRALHTLNFVDHVDRYGVQISSVREQIDLTSSMGRLMLTIAAAFAENERNLIVERTTAGLRRRVESGKITTPAPYGYTVEDGRLVIDEEKAEVVRTFFKWYAKGVGPLEIVRRLTEAGAPSPRGKGWRHDTLLYLLKQRAYAGDFVHFRTPRKRAADGARVPRDPSEQLVSKCPAIVTRRLFDAVQAQIQENKTHGPQSKKRTYLLRGLIRCGTCDLVYVGHAVGGRRYKDKVYPDFRYYECASLTNRDYKYCGSARVDARDIEEHVWSEVEGFLRRPSELTEKLLEQYRRQATGEVDAARKAARIRAAIKNRVAERNRIVGAVGRGKISEDDASDELHRLAAVVAALETDLDAAEDALAGSIRLKERIGDAREMLEALSSRLDQGLEADDKAGLIRLLVDDIKIITVNDQAGRKRPHAVVTYLFPSSKDIYFSSKGSASSDSSLKKYERRPRTAFEPERVRRLTRPPEARPYSAENWLVTTCTSSIASSGGWKRSRAARSSLSSRPSMVTLFEEAEPPASANVPASSGASAARRACPDSSRSSAASRVDSGSSVTPPSRKTKSSGERERTGRRSNSSRATEPPATVRVVSTSGASRSLTIVSSATTPAGRSVKSRRSDWPARVNTSLLSSAAKPARAARRVYAPGGSSNRR